jgi:hypothetical protein
VIRDAKGRKWFIRIRRYSNGFHWDARCGGLGRSAGEMFATKAEAEADVRRSITSDFDQFAASAEFFRRVQMRGSECRLTAADHRAIAQAGKVKS